LLESLVGSREHDIKTWLPLLHHPLCAFGHTRLEVLSAARALEKKVLRAPLTFKTWQLSQADYMTTHLHQKERETVASFLNCMAPLWKEFSFFNLSRVLESLMNGHLYPLSFDAQQFLNKTRERLKEGEILDQGAASKKMRNVQFSCLFSDLYQTTSHTQGRVRLLEPRDRHTIDSKDLVILAGCHRNFWEAPVQDVMGLTWPLLTMMGVVFDDDANQPGCLLDYENVVMTRSLSHQGQLLEPPAFWYQHQGQESTGLTMLSQMMRGTAQSPVPYKKTAPVVPCSLKPKNLSVSEIALLLQNPYGFFVQSVLRLKPLGPITPKPDSALFGSWIHCILEVTPDLKGLAYPSQLPLGWAQKADKIFGWLRQDPHYLDLDHTTSEMEKTLEGEIAGIHIRGRIDRINHQAEGGQIIDYKTGVVPSRKAVLTGQAPQLTLLGMLSTDARMTKVGYVGLKDHVWQWFNRDELQNAEDTIKATLKAYGKDDFSFEPAEKPTEHIAHFERRQEWEAA
jgi:RecB family exonuclease